MLYGPADGQIQKNIFDLSEGVLGCMLSGVEDQGLGRPLDRKNLEGRENRLTAPCNALKFHETAKGIFGKT